MTSGTSALQRETGHVERATPPRLTWVGAMEVMMEGCRYRLVPADTPANQTARADCDGPIGWAEPLTPRETQIARLVAQGLGNKEVAAALSISEWTVSTHLRRIFVKVGVDTRAAMVLRCFGARR